MRRARPFPACLAAALALALAACVTDDSRDAGVDRGTGTEVIGLVVNPDGTAAAAARVSLRSHRYLPIPDDNEADDSLPAVDVATDARGRFAVAGLPPGEYFVAARDQGALACLARFQVMAGKPTLILPADTLRPAARVSGKATWAPGFPYHRVRVAVYGMDKWTTVDSSGRFDLNGLPAGDLTLRFQTNIPAYFRSGELEIPLRPSQDTVLKPLVLESMALGSRSYWVDTAGSDVTGDGSAERPWRTLGFAAPRIPADLNHTLVMGAGIFYEPLGVKLPTGVNLSGQGPDRSVVASDQNQLHLITLANSPAVSGNQVLSGFRLDGMSRKLKIGIEVKGRHNVILRDLEVTGTRQQGIRIVNGDVGTAPGAYLRGIEVYHIRFRSCAEETPAVATSTGCLQLGGLDGARIHDLDIDEDEGRGINTAAAGYFMGLKIWNCRIRTPDSAAHPLSAYSISLQNLYEDCEIHDNDVDNPVSLIGGDKGRGLRSVSVRRNRIVADGEDAMPAGVVLGLSDAEVAENYFERTGVGVLAGAKPFSGLLVHHNVFFDAVGRTRGAGLRVLLESHAAGSVDVINNVFHNAAPGGPPSFGVEIEGRGRLDGLRMLNNVFLAANGRLGDHALKMSTEVVLEAPAFSHNLLAKGAEGSAAASFRNTVHALPGITGSGAKPLPYYRPATDTSNLVDAGTPAGLPYQGSGPDIGAYER